MLGPHFYYDLIRIARKGRTALLRCLYLLALLIGIWVIDRERPSGTLNRNALANNGQNIATAVIVLQYVLVVTLTPVLVSGAIVEERQRGTLELLFTTQLTDREIVLGKLAAHFANLAVIVLASLPLLAFVHFWGGIDMATVAFHYVQALMLLLVACAACLWASAEVATLFEALIVSYALLGAFGYNVLVIVPIISGTDGVNLPPDLTRYLALPAAYLASTVLFAWATVRAVRRRRTAHRLTDRPRIIAPRHPRRRPAARHTPWRPSRIHWLAWPIRGRALLWKEFVKDGDHLSLSFRWLSSVGLVEAFFCACYWAVIAIPWRHFEFERGMLIILTVFCVVPTYLLTLAIYVLTALVRVTSTVARERERDTLDALLLLPVARSEILGWKWFGAIGRGWPALAIAYAAVLFGLGCGLYGPFGALAFVLLPWPMLLMFSTLGLLLSVCCRRVVIANVLLAVALVAVFAGHGFMYDDCGLMFRVLARAALGWDWVRFADGEWERGVAIVLIEQAGFLGLAGVFAAGAFWRFERDRSPSAGKAW